MSDPDDNNKPSDPSGRKEELLSAIRAALAVEASADARAAGAIACRAILGVLEPSAVRNAAPSTGPSSFGASPLGAALGASPLGAALGALSSMPREQIVEFIVTGVRSVLGQGSAPAYRTAPIRRPGSGGE